MESAALIGLVDQLGGNLGQLEEALGPILEESLNATSKKLPLLDRAKLNITVVYAIESLLFCQSDLVGNANDGLLTFTAYLKVNGIDPKEHAIFKEIERVKQYFNKIKTAEEKSVVSKPNTTLNKQAAARIIQHSLVRQEVSPRIVSDKKQAGNGASDLTQREREARERLMLKMKQRSQPSTPNQITQPPLSTASTDEVQDISLPMPQNDNDTEMQQGGSSAEEGEIEDDEEEEGEVSVQASEPATTVKEYHSKKRKQKQASDTSSKLSADRKAEKRARKKAKKEAKLAANSFGNTV